MNRRAALTGGLLGLLAMAAEVRAEGERGQLGFSISVDGDGPFWNPVLKSATVAKVTPASPAASAGLVPGDQIVEVEGRTVAGAKARELEPLMARRPGERLSLRVRRADGSVQQLVLVAAARR